MPYGVGFSQDEITLLGSGSGELARRAELAWGCTRPSVRELSKERHLSLMAAGTAGYNHLWSCRGNSWGIPCLSSRVYLDFLPQGL